MLVFIDNSKTEENVFFVSEGNEVWKKEVFDSDGEGSLERSFNDLLNKYSVKMEDLKGVAVRVGVGRFTATRLAVSFANTLALALKIPVAATESESPDGISEVLKNTPVGLYISARYSAEPRLGGV